jgi:hypothetical protein
VGTREERGMSIYDERFEIQHDGEGDASSHEPVDIVSCYSLQI